MSDPSDPSDLRDFSDFRMPALGADMEKGTLLQWYVKPGDEVRRGQVIAEVDTAKSAIEIEVFENGVVDEIVVPVGVEVPVGTVLAHLRPAATRESRPVAGPGQSTAVPKGPVQAPLAVSPDLRKLADRLHVDLDTITGSGRKGKITRADIVKATLPTPGPSPAELRASSTAPRPAEQLRASPLARRRAADAGLDLAQLTGSGPGGAVTIADVEAALRTAAAPAQPAKPVPRPAAQAVDRQVAMRRAIGGLVTRSKREIPHYYLATTIDLRSAVTWLRDSNATLPAVKRILPVALLLKATALAAAAYSDMNGQFVDGEFRPAASVRLGVLISLRAGGLITPSIETADQLTVSELNDRLRDVATRAKAGRLRGSELGDPSLTVTNLGEPGVEAIYGVIFPPQVALVGFGSIVERPWAVDGLLGVRPVVTATLSADHRVSDGHRGALFLTTIAEHLNRPEDL
jgi:pyruvate dehydrogenase E2 component (dihydrolipoamide acetyltransferase)